MECHRWVLNVAHMVTGVQSWEDLFDKHAAEKTQV